MPTCEDDLTLDDLLISESASSRLTSGSSATSNLYAQIDRDQVWGLNLDEPPSASTRTAPSPNPAAPATASSSSGSSTPLANGTEGRAGEAKVVIKPWEDKDDESSWVDTNADVDDELIITIPFIQNVRVRSVLIKTGRGEYAPSVCRIYANRPEGLTFPDSLPVSEGGLKPSQEISLVSSSISAGGVTEYPLKVSVFADVVSLSLFFGGTEGGEKTRIYFIGCNGDPRNPSKGHDTDMTIPAAQGADAPIGGLRETAQPRNNTIR